MNFIRVIVLVILSALPFHAYSHETLRELQLISANDELVLRLSELIKENDQLKQNLKNALIAKSNGKKIVLGCDVNQVKKMLQFDNEQPYIANEWVKKNGEKCTQQQLKYLYDNVYRWTSWQTGFLKRTITYLMESQ